mmetsp:Transcript_88145/g.247956  ORF Transcript_88145/g.247956 Transcript_88145/m.247956 type:complete len:470 (-) Transcript_88145:295-1704(-)
MLAEVKLQPRRAARDRELDLLRLLVHEHDVRLALVAAGENRDHPKLLSVARRLRAVRQEPALLELYLVAATLERVVQDFEDGVAHLFRPRAHHVLHRLPRGLGPRPPEVVGLGVAVAMPLEVRDESLLEVFLAEHGVNHAHHAATFAVRDRVEDLLYCLGLADRHLDRMAAAKGIQLQGARLLHCDVALPDLPIRLELVGGEGLGPIGEALIEPEVVPPLHGDQVPEPLVGKLVRDHRADPLLLRHGDGLRVTQERHLPVGNEAPILHGARREVRNGDHVHLRERVWHPEEAVVELQGPDTAVQSVAALRDLARDAKDPHDRAVLRLAGNELELPDAERQQIGAHLGRGHEDVLLLAICAHLGPARRHVRDRHQVCRVDEGDDEDCLPARLVPAREAAPRIDGFELRRCHVALVTLRVSVLRTIKPGHLVIQRAAEGDLELAFAHRERLLETEAHRHRLGLRRDLRGLY